MNPPRILVTSTRAVLDAASRRGVDPGAVLSAHGLDPAVLADPDARLPADVTLRVWADAAARCGEPELPVVAAVELPWGAYRVIDYLCATADTLGDAIEQLARAFGIVNDNVRLSVEPRDDGGAAFRLVRASRTDRSEPIPAPYVDYALAACVFRMSFVIGADVHPTVRLRRAPPRDPGAHRRAFGPDVRFDAASDEVVFAPALWRARSRSPDPVLGSILRDHAERLLEGLPPVDPVIEQVRAAIERELPRGRAELLEIAAALGTSPRTLQRRLADAGLRWRDLVEQIRREVATARLRDPTLTVEEVAVMAGYADATAFHRAFLRWTGLPPGAWRRSR